MSIDAIKAVVDLIEIGGVVSQEEIVKCLRSAIEQAKKQEPVAGVLPCPFCGDADLGFEDGSTYRWGVAYCAGCGASAGETRREYPDAGKWHEEAIKQWNTRVAPPQRQPLTEEEIELLALKHAPPIHPDFTEDDDFIEFARAIERAHGIGGGE